MVRPSRRRNAEYVARGILVRPMERTIFGGGGGLASGCGVGDGVFVGFGLPNNWANLTSFQMPTEELTTNVDANVVMPAIAWSILG